MQDKLRYRTIGALFLAAVGLIVLPMLFDEPARKPLPEMERALFDQAKRAAQSADSDNTSDVDFPIYDDVVPTSKVAEEVTQLRSQVDAKGFSTKSHRTLFGEPILSPVRPDSGVFAVQLGTFVQLNNARRFREKLKTEASEAFISTFLDDGGGTKSNEKVRYRVAVGPLLSHTDADELRDALTKKYEINAIVVEMSQ
jgi:cell division septation protein DedD